MTQFESQKGDIQTCIEQCLNCYKVCLQTVATGLEINEDQDFITALQLCAQSCQLSAQALLLDSVFYEKTCSLCADLCESVAQICEQFDEPEIRECGEACLRCAQSCRRLSSHPATHQALPSDIRLV